MCSWPDPSMSLTKFDRGHYFLTVSEQRKNEKFKIYLRLLLVLNTSVIIVGAVLLWRSRKKLDSAVFESIAAFAVMWALVCFFGIISGYYACWSSDLSLLWICDWTNKLAGPLVVIASVFNSIRLLVVKSTVAETCVLFGFHLVAIQLHLMTWDVAGGLRPLWENALAVHKARRKKPKKT